MDHLKSIRRAVVVNHHDPDKLQKVRISKLYEFDGLDKVDVTEAKFGSIVAISGIADIHIGDTICSPENPESIPFQKISEPTISMNFIVNDSPLAGQEGKYVTSRHIRDRLFRELNTDVSLRVEETESADSYKVSGRGELHLSVLIENMRREGYEFAVSKAEVLYKYDENGKSLSQWSLLTLMFLMNLQEQSSLNSSGVKVSLEIWVLSPEDIQGLNSTSLHVDLSDTAESS